MSVGNDNNAFNYSERHEKSYAYLKSNILKTGLLVPYPAPALLQLDAGRDPIVSRFNIGTLRWTNVGAITNGTRAVDSMPSYVMSTLHDNGFYKVTVGVSTSPNNLPPANPDHPFLADDMFRRERDLEGLPTIPVETGLGMVEIYFNPPRFLRPELIAYYIRENNIPNVDTSIPNDAVLTLFHGYFSAEAPDHTGNARNTSLLAEIVEKGRKMVETNKSFIDATQRRAIKESIVQNEAIEKIAELKRKNFKSFETRDEIRKYEKIRDKSRATVMSHKEVIDSFKKQNRTIMSFIHVYREESITSPKLLGRTSYLTIQDYPRMAEKTSEMFALFYEFLIAALGIDVEPAILTTPQYFPHDGVSTPDIISAINSGPSEINRFKKIFRHWKYLKTPNAFYQNSAEMVSTGSQRMEFLRLTTTDRQWHRIMLTVEPHGTMSQFWHGAPLPHYTPRIKSDKIIALCQCIEAAKGAAGSGDGMFRHLFDIGKIQPFEELMGIQQILVHRLNTNILRADEYSRNRVIPTGDELGGYNDYRNSQQPYSQPFPENSVILTIAGTAVNPTEVNVTTSYHPNILPPIGGNNADNLALAPNQKYWNYYPGGAGENYVMRKTLPKLWYQDDGEISVERPDLFELHVESNYLRAHQTDHSISHREKVLFRFINLDNHEVKTEILLFNGDSLELDVDFESGPKMREELGAIPKI